MKALRITPLVHWLVLMLILGSMFFIAPMTNKVEASVARQEVSEPEGYASTCYSWRERRIQLRSGVVGVGPAVDVYMTVRYNGCRVYMLNRSCSAITTLISVRFEWCGAYQPSHWYQTHLHMGADYTLCTSPISGIGICWGEYVRANINADGRVTSYLGSGAPFINYWYR
jgi:hypothetical protein